MIEIKTLDYYNHPEFYRYMPQCLFTALEKAFLDGLSVALVPADEYFEMIHKIILSNGPENN